MSHLPGKLRYSGCCQEQVQQSPCLISGLLRMYLCYINCLRTPCWDAWKLHLKQCNQKKNIVFGREDDLKSIIWLPTFAYKKRPQETTLDHQPGSFQSISQSWLECIMVCVETTWIISETTWNLGAFDLAQVFLAFCVFTSFRWGLPATQCRFHRNKLMPWRTHGPW